MTEPERGPPAPPSRLEQLGYTQDLHRRLNVPEVVGLAMADVSPTMAVLFLSAGVFVVGGTFSIGAGLLLSVVVVLISLCLAELAGMFPIAGGMYSLVQKVLPGPLSWITMFNYLIQGVVIPASIALGIGAFLKNLIPGITLSDGVIAIILLALATALALTTVEIGAWATALMVVVELVVLSIITIAAFANPHQSLAEVTFHPTALSNGELVAVGFAVMLATLAPAFNVINGYDAALGFSEELKGGERNIGKAVIISAVLACVFIMVPLIAAVVAAPDLKEFFSAPGAGRVLGGGVAGYEGGRHRRRRCHRRAVQRDAVAAHVLRPRRLHHGSRRCLATAGEPNARQPQPVQGTRSRGAGAGRARRGAGLHLGAELPHHLRGHRHRRRVPVHRGGWPRCAAADPCPTSPPARSRCHCGRCHRW